LPVTCELLELEAPGVPIELSLEPIEPLDEPVPWSELDDPLDPVPIDPDEPLLEEPLPGLEPLDVDWAPTGNAMRRPAIPSPVTIPLTFMASLPCVARGAGQASCRVAPA
jgi:hypothetical protein